MGSTVVTYFSQRELDNLERLSHRLKTTKGKIIIKIVDLYLRGGEGELPADIEEAEGGKGDAVATYFDDFIIAELIRLSDILKISKPRLVRRIVAKYLADRV